MFNTGQTLYEKIQLYFTKTALCLCGGEDVGALGGIYRGLFRCDSILTSSSCGEQETALVYCEGGGPVTDLTSCFLIAELGGYLEQSCPLHPGLQWHLLGRMHRPPLRQGDEHTATGGGREIKGTSEGGGGSREIKGISEELGGVSCDLTVVTTHARPPGGTLALVRRHAPASVQARQDADGCGKKGEGLVFVLPVGT